MIKYLQEGLSPCQSPKQPRQKCDGQCYKGHPFTLNPGRSHGVHSLAPVLKEESRSLYFNLSEQITVVTVTKLPQPLLPVCLPPDGKCHIPRAAQYCGLGPDRSESPVLQLKSLKADPL
jgi:hypothetical protein